jgi:23S rRNA pseudouridine1911/1915/1917 synthase
VNFKPSKASYKIKRGEKIKVFIPPDKEIEIQPRDIPFEVIYEDEDIAVINKPSGIVVHPAPGHYDDTLVQGLILKLKNLSGIGGKIRPGIVHRLDKDTSGIMLVAKNDFAHKKLVEAFKERLIEKNYIALVYGRLTQKKGKIETFIGRHPIARKKMAVLKEGKLAITFYEVLEIFNKASLVLAKPVTGRTHQIRVHFSYIGHPVLGDSIYGA